MVGADDDVRAGLTDDLSADPVGFGEVIVEREFDPPAAQRVDALLVVALDDLDAQLGVALTQPLEQLRQQEGRDRLEARDDDGSAHLPLPGLDRIDGVGDPTEDLARLMEQTLAGRGEDEALRMLAHEERGPERPLELVDRRRHRRLRDVQLLARLGHVERLRTFGEVRQLSECDRESLHHCGPREEESVL
jgi:hypothetical protein